MILNLNAIHFTLACALVSALSLPAFGADIARGKTIFKDCRACHSVIDETETVIIRGGRTGPNLYGVVGRHAGSPTTELGQKSTRRERALQDVYSDATRRRVLAKKTL